MSKCEDTTKQTGKLCRSNVYLMGFMGCGKTVVGRLLAEFLDRSFLDTDETIVEETGMTIPQIFEKQGESSFRKLERSVVDRVSRLKGHVVALGGGAVLDPENWKKISRSGITITLSSPPGIIASRLSGQEGRPLLKETEGEGRRHRVTELMAQRDEVYKNADLVLHMNREVSLQRIVDMIVGYLGALT